jgi:hypothetical protein
LTIKDVGAGPNPGQWALLVNDTQQCLYMGEGQPSITVDAADVAHISDGVAPVAVPLLREMEDTGSITRQIISLVSSAPSLYPAWNANPMTVMYAAGFPRSAMLNLRQEIGGAPDCCTQFHGVAQDSAVPDRHGGGGFGRMAELCAVQGFRGRVRRGGVRGRRCRLHRDRTRRGGQGGRGAGDLELRGGTGHSWRADGRRIGEDGGERILRGRRSGVRRRHYRLDLCLDRGM